MINARCFNFRTSQKNDKPVFNFNNLASFSYLPGAAGVFLPSSRRHSEADEMSEANKWLDWLLVSCISATLRKFVVSVRARVCVTIQACS